MNRMEIRTDLALEAREDIEAKGEKESGVTFSEKTDENTGIRVTMVQIINEEGAKSIGKPVGNYITLEAESLELPDEDCHRQVSEKLAEELGRLIGKTMSRERGDQRKGKETVVAVGNLDSATASIPSVLAVGLGNRAVTSDSLGPKVVDELWITRHLEEASPKISGIVPGVMAQTGMESAQIAHAIVTETEPQLVIAIDALAARSASRLGTTIQLTDTGIHPGSGVGNHRHSLTKESLGVPVIAIGVPTVVGAAAMIYDTVQSFSMILRESGEVGAADWMDEQSPEERFQLIRELVEPALGPMMVTPKDIDERISQLSHTIAEGINMALLGAVE